MQLQVSILQLGLSPPSRSLLSSMNSTPPHWCRPALARRYAPPPLLMAASNLLAHRFSRFPHGFRNIASSTREFIARDGYGRPADGKENVRITSMDVTDGRRDTCEGIMEATYDPVDVLPNSSHRDGSIYRGTDEWKIDYQIANRNETRLEAMMLSDPTNCIIHNGTCRVHQAHSMLQIFSLKLAKVHVCSGSVELYGYIAVRDLLDPLLNYVVNFSRDDPLIVEQGSLINMAGPKRGIELYGAIVIEYDMRIKTGKQEKDDLQLIDGVASIDEVDTVSCRTITNRIHGSCGAIDITVSRFDFGVEATVEVFVSEVQSSFSLRLGCFINELPEEILLFDGTIGESRGLRRSVVVVEKNNWMDLEFIQGQRSWT